MKFILENQETREVKEIIGSKAQYSKPWKLIKTERESSDDLKRRATGTKRHAEYEAKIAVWATKFGLPVPQFLDAARWLLDKKCPFCQLGTQVLKRIDELGAEKAEVFLTRILSAKEDNNLDLLNQLKSELNG
jgi:hypothetical protein